MRIMLYLLLVCVLFSGAACQSAYYKTMETFGYHKRDILVDRVSESRDSQAEAKEQFASALEQFTEVLNFKGGKLQDKYDKLKNELEISEKRADEVRSNITKVEKVSKALFNEWENELEQYSNEKLRTSSEIKLRQTRTSYDRMIVAMKKAEEKMEPVLVAFRDQVLFLKHNLNAQAIASLQDEFGSIKSDIAVLIKQMEASIAEADEFIKSMGIE